MGYDGGVHTLRRFLEALGSNRTRLDKATIRFETPPGRQAQADWAYCGRFSDALGRTIPIYAFVIVLSFSRYMYVEFTTSMKLETLMNSVREGSGLSSLTFAGATRISSGHHGQETRIEIGGGLYHVITRGNDSRKIFRSHDDYLRFTSILAQQKLKMPFHL